MQAYAFPRISGARNPIVIVKIFIFIFLRLKVVLQAKPCMGGRNVRRISNLKLTSPQLDELPAAFE